VDALNALPLGKDVRVFRDAVRFALDYDEFFQPQEVARAKEMLQAGIARAEELMSGRAPWNTATGLVVRGYVSKIDRSVQPYGLVVPSSWDPKLPRKWRLDCWFHGRNETLSEVNFLYDRMRNPGEFTPEDTIVLHLYGRHNNANKFAGEVDLFEAIEDVKRHYRIDENRILVRGFSMGGASTWQFATHFAGRWAAAAPGAGFSESADFLKVWQRETIKPTAWEQKLWHMYDATDYAANLFNLPIVAYNGDQDGQKQAADMMEKAMAEEGLRLTRVTGPQTGHRYHPDSKVEINAKIDAIAERGRDPWPKRLRFTTWTLRYNEMKWLRIDALDKHWERARLDADVTAENTIRIKAENVAAFRVDAGPGAGLMAPSRTVDVVINGQTVKVPGAASDGSFAASFEKAGNRWAVAAAAPKEGLHKRHGLQGPVDDAFMDSFLFVKPTGQPAAPGVAAWVAAEQGRAIKEWRRHFRGEPQVKDDTAVTESDIASSNLVLWGDPGSNKILAKIVSQLPLKWTGEQLTLGGANYPASTHAPILIYPNPLNPKRYVVLNSGFTYREYDYLNNAREISKLPDWAVVDTTTPPGPRFPGKIVTADFFNENWK